MDKLIGMVEALIGKKDEYVHLKKKLSEELKGELHSTFVELFRAYPKLKSYSWDQYAPHFNDGDACVFSVYNARITLESDDGENEFDLDEPEAFDGVNEKLKKGAAVSSWEENMAECIKSCQSSLGVFSAVEKVHGVIAGFDDIMKEVYEEDCTVTVTRTVNDSVLVTTDHCDHD